MAQVRLKNDLCRFSPRLPKTDAIRVSSVSKYGIKKIGILRYGSSTKTDVKFEEKSTCANKYSAAQPTTCGIVTVSQNKCSILDLAPEPSHNRRYVANCDFLSNPFFYSRCFILYASHFYPRAGREKSLRHTVYSQRILLLCCRCIACLTRAGVAISGCAAEQRAAIDRRVKRGVTD